MSLTEFVADRLAEDEAAAKAANGLDWLEDDGDEPGDSWILNEHMHLFETDTVTAVHVTRHDQARVLREVEAKRAILAAYQEALTIQAGFKEVSSEEANREALEMACKALAAAYSDHPGYDPAWKE